MSDKTQLLKRIVINPHVMLGKPTITGTRLTVQFILGLLAQGMTVDEITAEYKGLTQDDIRACLFFATEALESTSFAPLVESSLVG
jgi:uncharacterized protein (DUF433 family)